MLALSARRASCALASSFVAALASACASVEPNESLDPSRLTARPRTPTRAIGPGLYPLGLGTGARDGQVLVPANYGPDIPIPLVVLLHGASGTGSAMVNAMRTTAESLGIALLAPDSRDSTWDGIWPAFGPDVQFIDQALASVFDRVRIDPLRVRLAGFSDGASYALGLGRVNGDLFTRVVAWSPITIPAGTPHGHPSFFVTQGLQDSQMVLERTRAELIPSLRNSGFGVDYREFNGGHEIPPDLRQAAAEWMLAR